MRPLFWPLFARSAWAQPATVVAGTTVEGTTLASVLFVGVGTASHYGSGRVLSHCGYGPIGNGVVWSRLLSVGVISVTMVAHR